MYRVIRGPISPPASTMHGQVQHLETGDTLHSADTPWTRQCVRDGRIELVEEPAAAAAEDNAPDARTPRKKGKTP